MYKLCLAALLSLPMMTYAQALPEGKAPVGSLTESFVYVFNDAQNGHNRSLMGWSVVPEVNFEKHIGLQGDFETLYMRSVYPGQSRWIAAAGPRYTLAPKYKATPFVFAEGGEMRLSVQYSPIKDWNPVAIGGFGFEGRISRGIAFTLIPGEYIGQYQDNSLWNHSFSARAGITFNLYK